MSRLGFRGRSPVVYEDSSFLAAPYGGFSGGVISLSSKSGTNQFHGNAYEYFRNDALNANSWLRKQSTDPNIANNPPHSPGVTAPRTPAPINAPVAAPARSIRRAAAASCRPRRRAR